MLTLCLHIYQFEVEVRFLSLVRPNSDFMLRHWMNVTRSGWMSAVAQGVCWCPCIDFEERVNDRCINSEYRYDLWTSAYILKAKLLCELTASRWAHTEAKATWTEEPIDKTHLAIAMPMTKTPSERRNLILTFLSRMLGSPQTLSGLLTSTWLFGHPWARI